MLRTGIILLDGDELILRIYQTETQKEWKLFRYQSYDLGYGIPDKHPTAREFVELIAKILLTRFASTTSEWKICTRNTHEKILQDITKATGITIEALTLQREQELLCKGIITEMQ